MNEFLRDCFKTENEKEKLKKLSVFIYQYKFFKIQEFEIILKLFKIKENQLKVIDYFSIYRDALGYPFSLMEAKDWFMFITKLSKTYFTTDRDILTILDKLQYCCDDEESTLDFDNELCQLIDIIQSEVFRSFALSICKKICKIPPVVHARLGKQCRVASSEQSFVVVSYFYLTFLM